jgi:hypothetical protein
MGIEAIMAYLTCCSRIHMEEVMKSAKRMIKILAAEIRTGQGRSVTP